MGTIPGRIGLAALVLAMLAGGLAALPAAASIDDSECLECHDEIDHDAYEASAHGRNACNSCHFDVVDIAVHETCGSRTQDKVETCHRCHPDEGRQHFASVHMWNDVRCTDCHSEIHSLGKAEGSKQDRVAMCTGCHDGGEYTASAHGQAVLAGNQDAASCSDCHGLHRVEEVGTPGTHAYREFHTQTCYGCHADITVMGRNQVPTIPVRTYEQSYHGKVEALGSGLAAGCSDCHTAHLVLPADDEASSTHPNNLTRTCAECHPAATPKFALFLPHADYHDKGHYPVLYYTWLTMTGLLVSVFALFWVHTFLWWRKAYWESHLRAAEGEFDHAEVDQPLKPYRRFNVYERLAHVVMVVSFLGLVVTGLPLKFHDAAWAPAIMNLMGGPHRAGLIHRICAMVTFGYFFSTCAYLAYYLFFKPTGESFWQKLFGPDSLFPNLRDLKDLGAMIRWFLGWGKEPTFERWTYWEKFDFLAVFWGMFAIGLSGLFLWFPEFFARYLPGWIFNVAIIVHSDEALLATGFIFTVHFFNTHFRPGKFPMDTAIFSGRVPRVEMLVERKDWAARLEAGGGLARHEANPTRHPIVDLVGELFGLGALGVGLTCIALIVWGFAAH